MPLRPKNFYPPLAGPYLGGIFRKNSVKGRRGLGGGPKIILMIISLKLRLLAVSCFASVRVKKVGFHPNWIPYPPAFFVKQIDALRINFPTKKGY